jgi:hypothetical protein
MRGAGDAVDGDDVIVPPGESPNTYTFTRHAIRSNYMDKSIEAKKKVKEKSILVIIIIIFQHEFRPGWPVLVSAVIV